MKYKAILLWSFLFVLLFAFFQINSEYHFYYIEQNQLFLNSWSYIREQFALPGGAALVLSEFLVQFFIYPYAGALISSLLLIFCGVGTAGIFRKISLQADYWPILSLLPLLSLLLVQSDFNYYMQGTIAFLLLLGALRGFFFFKVPVERFCYTLLMALLLFWFAGSVALLFSLSVLLIKLSKPSRKVCWYLIPLGAVVLCSISGVYLGFWGEYRLAFLPDLYYCHRLKPNGIIYFSWIALLISMSVVVFMKQKHEVGKKRQLFIYIFQFMLFSIFCYVGIQKFFDHKADLYKKLDYYARTEQWDQIIKESAGKKYKNYLYQAILNLALAEKGQLGERIFSFDQIGVDGIFPSWNKSTNISILLCDIFFAMGNVANSQEMAFESYESAPGYGNPRMLKRLVQTNLIYGSWPVAEKYIAILEQTVYYKDWAKKQRRFLYDDAAVERDPLLGSKRKGLPSTNKNILIVSDMLDQSLINIAESNPSNRTAIEYLGSIYLLKREMNVFQALLERYYGTDVLPKLPRSFQEAVIILFEAKPEMWQKYGIDDKIVYRFGEYKKQVISMKYNSAASSLLYRSFGDTYWFYYMFK